MGKIYKNQDALTIQLTVGQDITGATCKVKYQKPSAATGFWTGSITDAANGIFEYDVQDTDLDESGKWRFWADVTFSDDSWAPGEVVLEYVYEPGE